MKKLIRKRENRHSKRLVVSVMASMVLAAGLAIFAASPASAYYGTGSGRPGSITLYRTAGTGNYLSGPAGFLDSGRIIVNRSTAYGGAQKITVRWRVWRYSAAQGWSAVTAPWTTFTANPGQRVDTPGWRMTDRVGGTFATDIEIHWHTDKGVFLGRSFADYIYAGDYQCNNAPTFCRIDVAGGQYTITI